MPEHLIFTSIDRYFLSPSRARQRFADITVRALPSIHRSIDPSTRVIATISNTEMVAFAPDFVGILLRQRNETRSSKKSAKKGSHQVH